VVTLYGWAAPVTWEVEELRYGFMDSDIAYADIDRILRAARWAHDRWRGGDRVLIRCQAGLNRSGLVTALVLMRDGYDATEAISLIRERRSPWALCNDDFVRWLHEDTPAALAAVS
jgi:protein-tyrosine phosphatase